MAQRFGCCVLVLAFACGEKQVFAVGLTPIPELDVQLSSDLALPKDVDSITVGVAGSRPRLFELGPAGLSLPAILEGIPFLPAQQGPPTTETLDITVTAFKGSTPFTVTRAVGTIPYQVGRRVIRMSLTDSRAFLFHELGVTVKLAGKPSL